MSGPTSAERMERGRLLFNAGRFFEAHEAWEEAWLAEEGKTRAFLQGLIQIAAGFHKAFGQMQPKGCVRLLEAGLSKIEGVAMLALQVDAFVESAREFLEEARRWERGEIAGLDASARPRLEKAAAAAPR